MRLLFARRRWWSRWSSSGDAEKADGGGSRPGMGIRKGAESRAFFLAIVDLFYVREHVVRRRAYPHRFGGRVGKGLSLALAWYLSLLRFRRPGPISGPERSLDLFRRLQARKPRLRDSCAEIRTLCARFQPENCVFRIRSRPELRRQVAQTLQHRGEPLASLRDSTASGRRGIQAWS